MNSENPFTQVPYEPKTKTEEEIQEEKERRSAYEAEQAKVPIQRIDPLEWYGADSIEYLSIKTFIDLHPEAYEKALYLSNPDISDEDFTNEITEWNDNVNKGDLLAEGLYTQAHFPIDHRVGRRLSVKFFENGRITFSG